ncbi:hypothetical protein GGR50DRAFT_547507 [Xylaria sp. CBS 124048]|nr:hypothetical protein GGR50DRAFT_547507 [Xylaria sp. CBS 124048]
MAIRQLTAVALLALAAFANADDKKGVETPAQSPILGTDTVAGCYSSLGDMTKDNTNKFNTQGACAGTCRDKGLPVGATYADTCFCGTKMPNKKTLLPDSTCNEPCPGFDPQACGGLNAFTVYNTGVLFNVAEAELPSSSVSTSSATSTSTTQSAAETSVASSAAPLPSSSSDSNGGSSKKVGIAVGVVIGVVAISAIIAGVYFYIRRKRNSELEEEHRRNAAVNNFIQNGKPRSSGGMSIADSRMDPIMNRRMSDGSIADNQDYSRRILRVCYTLILSSQLY